MLCIFKGIFLLSLVFGAYGGQCYTSGTKITCTDEFMGESLTLESNLKSCQRPVKIEFKLDIRGLTFYKEFDGDEDIPLPELSFSGLGGVFLNVNANPLDSGDLELKIGIIGKVEVLGVERSLTILSKTIPNSDCNAYLIWWNSQSWWTSQPLVVKIAIPSSAGLLLILSIIACYCCCCRASGSRGGVVGRQTTFAIPSKFPLHNPAENQFNYKTQVNVTNVNA